MKNAHLRFEKGFHVVFGNRRTQAAQMVLEPGASEGDSQNRHRGADQWLFVVEGTGAAVISGKTHRLRAGTLLLIEQKDRHEIRNTGKGLLKTVNFYSPPAYTAAGNPKPRGRP